MRAAGNCAELLNLFLILHPVKLLRTDKIGFNRVSFLLHNKLLPVISSGRSRFIIFKIVGATSESMPCG